MIATHRKIYMDKILDNLLDAQKNMASAEKVDAKGLIYLSRFILRLLKQLDLDNSFKSFVNVRSLLFVVKHGILPHQLLSKRVIQWVLDRKTT